MAGQFQWFETVAKPKRKGIMQRVIKFSMLHRFRKIEIVNDFLIASLVQKLQWFCRTGQIGCSSKDINVGLGGPTYCAK